MSQSLVMVFLGGAVLRITLLSTTYLNYVKPAFHPFLVAAGAVVLALGVAGLIQEWRKPYLTEQEYAHRSHAGRGSHGDRHDARYDEHGEAVRHDAHENAHHDGHDHSRGPRVAWLLCLPVFAIFLIAPPALGAFAARSEEPPPRPPVTSDTYAPLADETVTAMPIGEFIGRAWADSTYSLTGKRVRLTGFVVPSKKKDRWYVTRIQLNCCAADGIPLKVAVLKAAQPPVDTWVEVTGTWVRPKSDKIPNGTVAPELVATDVTAIPRPVEPYE
ncbi:TIGR03943 family putative permease subunit [Microtetraspora fusca]|uniref:TIGR03943 family putative permease subunit n=1 Tax=Microtetraspora fusca TaxID=1997 RepID=A0ABW6V009_MICFU